MINVKMFYAYFLPISMKIHPHNSIKLPSGIEFALASKRDNAIVIGTTAIKRYILNGRWKENMLYVYN